MARKGLGSVSGAGWLMGARGSQGGTVGILGVTGGILGGLNGIQGGTGVFLAEKFESPTRCIESLAPPIGPRPFEPVQKPIGKDGLLCQNLYICNQGRNQSRKSVAIACFAMDYKSFSGLCFAVLPFRQAELDDGKLNI